jgi:hypothetical protein
LSSFDNGFTVGYVIGKKQGGSAPPVQDDLLGGKSILITIPSPDLDVSEYTTYGPIPYGFFSYALQFKSSLNKWVNSRYDIFYDDIRSLSEYIFGEGDKVVELTGGESEPPTFTTLVEVI